VPDPALGRKLLNHAHASKRVPSIEECASDNGGTTFSCAKIPADATSDHRGRDQHVLSDVSSWDIAADPAPRSRMLDGGR
jgi:hypothetical protein